MPCHHEDGLMLILDRLMETHNLRTLYSPSLSGLHSRTYQLKKLMTQISPELLTHLTDLGLEPAYLSQWFMTIFATNCPLNVLFRIYDVIFAEGADETIMRVALALILSNEQKLLAMTELEEILHLLLGRGIWEPYQNEPDFLMDEIARLSNIVTRVELDRLEDQFVAQASSGSGEKAARALGFSSKMFGWWGASSPADKKTGLSPSDNSGHAPRRSVSISKQSITTTDSSGGSGSGADSLISNEGTASTAATEAEKDTDRGSIKSTRTQRQEDRSLHEQVEGLLLALTEVQREAAQTAEKLRVEHARKESMASIVWRLRDIVIQKEEESQARQSFEQSPDTPVGRDRRKTMPSKVAVNQAEGILKELHRRSAAINSMARSVSLNNLGNTAPDEELQESLARLCALLDADDASPEMNTPKSDNEPFSYFGQRSNSRTDNDQLTRPKRRESVKYGPMSRRPTAPHFPKVDRMSSVVTTGSCYSDQEEYEPANGEALDRWPESMYEDIAESPITEQPLAPRQSSLQARDILATAGEKPPTDEAILMELVNAKTREAAAIQQRDEMRSAMEKLRKQHEEAFEAQQAAHRAELDKLRKSIAVVKTIPTLEVKPVAEGSLWPSPAPSPRDPVTPAKKDAVAGAENLGGWGWFSRSGSKPRSVSTGNASMTG